MENKLVVVTGGTRGIGKAITKRFLDEGATVVATYVSNDEAAKAFLDEVTSKNLILKKSDVRDEDSVIKLFSEIDDLSIPLTVLVNNSGIRRDSITAAMEAKDWSAVIDTNLTGTFLMSKHAVLRMMKTRYGRIINISSLGGTMGIEGQANYSASKAGVVALSKSLSKEVGKRGITVNSVCPGFIDTELLSDLPEELVKAYKKSVPLKRFGKPSEVAAAVAFLASDDASYITGSTIEVTGGL